MTRVRAVHVLCGEHVADRINSSPYGRSEEIQDGTQHFGSEANPLNVWSLLHKGLAKEPTLRLIRKRRICHFFRML